MTAAGVYTITVTATGYDGNTYFDSIVPTVLYRAKLDALLEAKWEGMKAALMRGDVEGALGYFAESSKEAYRAHFNALSDILPQIAADIGSVRLVKVREHFAEYDLRTVQNGTAYSYQVLFNRTTRVYRAFEVFNRKREDAK
jgi:hypothetical protein